MPVYKLKYFDGRGRGEVPRLMFAEAGQKYEDIRISTSHCHLLHTNLVSLLEKVEEIPLREHSNII